MIPKEEKSAGRWKQWIVPAVVVSIFLGYRTLIGSSLTRDLIQGTKFRSTSQLQTVKPSKKTERQTWLDYYDSGECVSNIKTKISKDADYRRIKEEIGAVTFKQIINNSMDKYCLCVSTSRADGDTLSSTTNACRPIIQQEIKRVLYGMG